MRISVLVFKYLYFSREKSLSFIEDVLQEKVIGERCISVLDFIC